jgi:hypothetical protein
MVLSILKHIEFKIGVLVGSSLTFVKILSTQWLCMSRQFLMGQQGRMKCIERIFNQVIKFCSEDQPVETTAFGKIFRGLGKGNQNQDID